MRSPDERRRRFEEIYEACHDPVLGYVLRRTGNGHDAADVLAETFLTAWRRLEDIPAGEQTRPWLYGVARRVLANHHRGERRRMALADQLRAEPAEVTIADHDGNLDAITHAFRALPERERELLSLVAWEGLDIGQIATALGCSRNAARVRLHRARRRFAAVLEHDTPAEAGPQMAPVTKGPRT